MKVVSFAGTLSSTALTIGPGGSATIDVTGAVSGDFVGNVKVVCSSSVSIGCTASPAEGTISQGNPLRSVLSLHASSAAAIFATNRRGIFLALLLPFAAIVIRTWRDRRGGILMVILVSGCLLSSCGGGGSGNGGPPPVDRTYTVQVQLQTVRGADTVTTDIGKIMVTVHD